MSSGGNSTGKGPEAGWVAELRNLKGSRRLVVRSEGEGGLRLEEQAGGHTQGPVGLVKF